MNEHNHGLLVKQKFNSFIGLLGSIIIIIIIGTAEISIQR